MQLFTLFFTQGETSNQYSAGIFVIADRDHVFVATDEHHGFGFDQVALFLPIDVEVAFFEVFEGLGVCMRIKSVSRYEIFSSAYVILRSFRRVKVSMWAM